MKKNRLYFGMLILMLVAVIIWAFYNMLNVGKAGDVLPRLRGCREQQQRPLDFPQTGA